MPLGATGGGHWTGVPDGGGRVGTARPTTEMGTGHRHWAPGLTGLAPVVLLLVGMSPMRCQAEVVGALPLSQLPGDWAM